MSDFCIADEKFMQDSPTDPLLGWDNQPSRNRNYALCTIRHPWCPRLILPMGLFNIQASVAQSTTSSHERMEKGKNYLLCTLNKNHKLQISLGNTILQDVEVVHHWKRLVDHLQRTSSLPKTTITHLEQCTFNDNSWTLWRPKKLLPPNSYNHWGDNGY